MYFRTFTRHLHVIFISTTYICTQAFAWFSELLVEHAEIFWALFGVDMDRVLAEQPPDTWDSFPLFQILNDYLRTDGELNRSDRHLSKSNLSKLCRLTMTLLILSS